MLKKKLNEYLGEIVRITDFEDDITEGVLHQCEEEEFKDNPNLHGSPGYYFCKNENNYGFLFRSSHVKKCESKRTELKKN